DCGEGRENSESKVGEGRRGGYGWGCFGSEIQGADHLIADGLYGVRINHGGLHTRVPEQFLHGADVVTRLQKVCREAMPQRMRRSPLRQSGFQRSEERRVGKEG